MYLEMTFASDKAGSADCHSWILNLIRPSCAFQNLRGERSQKGLELPNSADKS